MRWPIALGVIGLAGGAMGEFAPLVFPNSPSWVWEIAFWVSVAVIVGAFIWAVQPVQSRVLTNPRANWREEDVVTYLLANSKQMRWRSADDRLVDEIELALRDAARSGAVHSWGRPRREEGATVSRTERPIPKENWDADYFIIMDGVGTDGNKPLRRRINIYGTNNYLDVKFNKKEIAKEWPRANCFVRLFDTSRWARIRLTKGERVKDGKG